MALFNLLKKTITSKVIQEDTSYKYLFDKIDKAFPGIEENDLLLSACISGLLARVMYADFEAHEKELEQMRTVLDEFSFSPNIDSKVVTNIATEHIKEMSGLDNHLYIEPINKLLSKEKRFKVLKSLFIIAASDGNVDSVETEEIRRIAKSLELSSQHFIVAKSEVNEYIGALK